MRRNTRKANWEKPAPLVGCTQAQLDIANRVEGAKIDDKIYKGVKPTYIVRTALREIFYNKCAYCESTECKPEVEHYRPKAAVTGINGHQGYYWLCYEWTNLLPSCRYCNTEGGKQNQFPVINEIHRQTHPIFLLNGALDTDACNAANHPLIAEQPYLLHPEIDTPEDCFEFDNDGNIKGIDVNGRGQKTIEICDLQRENLTERRKNLIDDFKEKIDNAFDDYFKGALNESGLEAKIVKIFLNHEFKTHPDKPFSLVAIQCISRFEEIILPLFHYVQQAVLLQALNFLKNAVKP